MRQALVFAFVGSALCSPGAGASDTLLHPSIQEVLRMTRGGVSYDVVVERVRRMPARAVLDAEAIATLRAKGVPDRVIFELVRERSTPEPCAGREATVGFRQVFEHPSIRAVLRDVDAGVATGQIVEHVKRLKRVPVLEARALTRLTSRGVPDRALLELVLKQDIQQACDPVGAEAVVAASEDETVADAGPPAWANRPVARITTSRAESRAFAPTAKQAATRSAAPIVAAASTAPAGSPRPAELPPAEPTTSTGRIRVVARSSLPVTYLEVRLDGKSVTRKGEVPQGVTRPGWTLPPALVLDVKRGAVVFESEVAPGPYEVQTEFALSQIVETDWDPVREASGQRYATISAGPVGEHGQVPVCEVRAGRTCVVFARLLRRGERLAVKYTTKMR